MEGIHQPRYVLTHRCDQEAGKQLAGFNVRGGLSRLVRWDHSLAVVADCARAERVIMMLLLIALMMMIITITDDYNKSAPHIQSQVLRCV